MCLCESSILERTYSENRKDSTKGMFLSNFSFMPANIICFFLKNKIFEIKSVVSQIINLYCACNRYNLRKFLSLSLSLNCLLFYLNISPRQKCHKISIHERETDIPI